MLHLVLFSMLFVLNYEKEFHRLTRQIRSSQQRTQTPVKLVSQSSSRVLSRNQIKKSQSSHFGKKSSSGSQLSIASRLQEHGRRKKSWGIRQRATQSFLRQRRMIALLNLKRISQKRFPGRDHMICTGDFKFSCSPRDEKIEVFLASQWRRSRNRFYNFPKVKMVRHSGTWHLYELSKFQ